MFTKLHIIILTESYSNGTTVATWRSSQAVGGLRGSAVAGARGDAAAAGPGRAADHGRGGAMVVPWLGNRVLHLGVGQGYLELVGALGCWG